MLKLVSYFLLAVLLYNSYDTLGSILDPQFENHEKEFINFDGKPIAKSSKKFLQDNVPFLTRYRNNVFIDNNYKGRKILSDYNYEEISIGLVYYAVYEKDYCLMVFNIVGESAIVFWKIEGKEAIPNLKVSKTLPQVYSMNKYIIDSTTFIEVKTGGGHGPGISSYEYNLYELSSSHNLNLTFSTLASEKLIPETAKNKSYDTMFEIKKENGNIILYSNNISHGKSIIKKKYILRNHQFVNIDK